MGARGKLEKLLRREYSGGVIQRLPFRYPGTDQDVQQLERLLRDGLHAVGFRPSQPVSVLNLACGRADETGALAAALAPAKIGFYLGMDLRSETVAEATQRWMLPDGILDFRCGDASKIHQMRLLPPIDFIFIRHQNYWHEPAVWECLLENALSVLKPGGLFGCTSYFDHEHELLLAALKSRGARLLTNVRNPSSRAVPDAADKSVDRWLALFSKPGAIERVDLVSIRGRMAEHVER